MPIIAVVEEEPHALAFFKDLFDEGSIDAPVSIVFDIFQLTASSRTTENERAVSDAELLRRFKVLYPKPTKYQTASFARLETALEEGTDDQLIDREAAEKVLIEQNAGKACGSGLDSVYHGFYQEYWIGRAATKLSLLALSG